MKTYNTRGFYCKVCHELIIFLEGSVGVLCKKCNSSYYISKDGSFELTDINEQYIKDKKKSFWKFW